MLYNLQLRELHLVACLSCSPMVLTTHRDPTAKPGSALSCWVALARFPNSASTRLFTRKEGLKTAEVESLTVLEARIRNPGTTEQAPGGSEGGSIPGLFPASGGCQGSLACRHVTPNSAFISVSTSSSLCAVSHRSSACHLIEGLLR